VGVIPEDWEVVKVGEKFDFLKTYSNSRAELNSIDEINYIHYGEIHKKHKFYIDFAKFELPKINKSKLPNEIIFAQNGDLVIADASEDYADIGKSAEIKNLTSKAVSGLHTFLLRDKNNNFVDGYKGYLLYNETVTKSIKKIATGISVLSISKTNLSNLQIPLPPLKEQEKIAEILTTWDEAISKQTELIKEKELLKKALMQKLLSGEVRFDGFSDEWEEVKLGGIGEFKTSSIDKIVNENEKLVNLINYMDVYRNKHIDKNFKCSETSLKEEQYEKVNLKKGDILFTPSSETPDDIGHSAVIIEDLANTVYSYHLVRFRPKKSIDIKFSGYVFNNVDILKEFARRANGSTRFTLSIKDFNETKVQLPSLEEQQKIAEVLSLADAEINLLKNELKELKLQKKALMQKLLTGEVRVKV
jgi:type I restriction enzyme S subunit